MNILRIFSVKVDKLNIDDANDIEKTFEYT